MTRYELKLYMSNGCGSALLGDVAWVEAPDAEAATAEARRRVSALPKHCFGALIDGAGVEIWSGSADRRSVAGAASGSGPA